MKMSALPAPLTTTLITKESAAKLNPVVRFSTAQLEYVKDVIKATHLSMENVSELSFRI